MSLRFAPHHVCDSLEKRRSQTFGTFAPVLSDRRELFVRNHAMSQKGTHGKESSREQCTLQYRLRHKLRSDVADAIVTGVKDSSLRHFLTLKGKGPDRPADRESPSGRNLPTRLFPYLLRATASWRKTLSLSLSELAERLGEVCREAAHFTCSLIPSQPPVVGTLRLAQHRDDVAAIKGQIV